MKWLSIYILVLFCFSCSGNINISNKPTDEIKTVKNSDYDEYHKNCDNVVKISNCINSSYCQGYSCETLSCGNICYQKYIEYFNEYKKCITYLSSARYFENIYSVIDYHEKMHRFIKNKNECVKRTQSIAY